MISIIRATEEDNNVIVDIGNISVREAHKDSCSVEDMTDYLERNYNNETIQEELSNPTNIYHIIYYNGNPVGFSKIILNAVHSNIVAKNVTMLDRIYLLKEFHSLKLGLELMNFNIEFSRNNNQSGIWLYTWIGNRRAIDFYGKVGFTIIGSYKFYVTKTYYNMNHQMFLHLP